MRERVDSGWNTMAPTRSLCPRNVLTSSQFSTFHSLQRPLLSKDRGERYLQIHTCLHHGLHTQHVLLYKTPNICQMSQLKACQHPRVSPTNVTYVNVSPTRTMSQWPTSCYWVRSDRMTQVRCHPPGCTGLSVTAGGVRVTE